MARSGIGSSSGLHAIAGYIYTTSMRVLVFVALCASASGFRFSTSVNVQQHRRRLVAATVPSRVALFMDAGKDDDDTPLPVPSITSLAYAAIVFLQSKDTYDSPVVREWVSKGFPLDSIQGVLPSILGNGILVGYGLFQLGKMAGIGKTDYYGDLEGPEVGSLSQQAATWALAGEVPTRSADGAYEVATFAGGCFWGTGSDPLPGIGHALSSLLAAACCLLLAACCLLLAACRSSGSCCPLT